VIAGAERNDAFLGAVVTVVHGNMKNIMPMEIVFPQVMQEYDERGRESMKSKEFEQDQASLSEFQRV
jgi:hypothetical protein